MSLFPLMSPYVFEAAYLQTSAPASVVSTTISFASQNAGVADPGRTIVAVFNIEGNTGGAGVANSVSIGGISANIDVQNVDGDEIVVIASAIVPTGTSIAVSIVLSINTSYNAVVSLYRAMNLDNSAPTDTDSNDDDIVSMTVDVLDGGFIVAAAGFESSSSITTVGVTENNEEVLTGNNVAGSTFNLAAQTGRTISFDGGAGNAAGVCASYR